MSMNLLFCPLQLTPLLQKHFFPLKFYSVDLHCSAWWESQSIGALLRADLPNATVDRQNTMTSGRTSETSFLLGTGAAAESQPPSIHKVAQNPWYRRGKWKCGIISIIICGAVTLFALFIIIPATSNVRLQVCVCVCLYMIFDHHPLTFIFTVLVLGCTVWFMLHLPLQCEATNIFIYIFSFFSSRFFSSSFL